MAARGIDDTLFPFVARLSESARRELRAVPVRRLGKGTLLLTRGDPVDGAYLVVGGALRVFYITPEGRESTLYRVGAGDTCVFALTATFSRDAYPAWVQSGDRGAAVVNLPSDTFSRLLDTEVGFREFVFNAISGRLFELMLALEEAGSARVEQRVARYLLKNRAADGTVYATQAGIASELGTAREVVFRALRALAERGSIRKRRLAIDVLDVAALESVAGDGQRDPGSRRAPTRTVR